MLLIQKKKALELLIELVLVLVLLLVVLLSLLLLLLLMHLHPFWAAVFPSTHRDTRCPEPRTETPFWPFQ